jgi:5-hydroxyisourate hydrolase-like protein (transthyretin family)
MLGYLKFAAVACVLVASLSVARADEAARKQEKGTVAGTIKGTDGNPAAGVEVKLYNPMDRQQRRAERKGEGDKDKAAKKEKSDRPTPVTSATTDNDGKFSVSDVPAGSYNVQASIKHGPRARQDVEVRAGETTTIDLTLADRKDDKSAAAGEEKKEEHKDEKSDEKKSEEN